MFDLNLYIASGVIESYCLGNLSDAEAQALTQLAAQYPALQAEIDKTLAVLEPYSGQNAPAADLKERTLQFLSTFLKQEAISLAQPPMINQYSDAKAWQEAVKGLQPEHQEDGFAFRFLKESPEVELNLVWLYGEMIEDQHPEEDFAESFLILEGACECDFGGQIVRFSAGDYFDIPPGVNHVIKNISVHSNYVKGLVQRRKAA